MNKIIIATLLLFSSISLFGQAIKVEITQIDNQWTLVRDGKPYYIKGAGGKGDLDVLVNAGGNSVRIWSADDAEEMLDKAQSKGLTVMFGLWVQHERHGFDYNNEEAVKAQLEYFRKIVTKYKDHPAVLLWSIGNEVDLTYSNYKVWDAVQDIAAMIHEIDPNHPTATVTAGLHEREIKLVKEKCPDIDIFGVNTYSEACSIADNMKNWGWTGPYIISEWGPNGHWEVDKTKWLAPVEQSSHEKALSYQKRYNCILNDRQHCVGSYVFLWGQKQETTSTWYGLFTKDGKYTETIDYLTKAWSGNWPENKAPSLDNIIVNKQKKGDNIYLIAEEKYPAEVFVTDEDIKKLKIKWQVYPESDDIKIGGDVESEPVPVSRTVVKQKNTSLIFRAPSQEGAYRLFATVSDKQGKVAYVNVPFYVNPRDQKLGQGKAVQLKKRKLEIPN